MSEWTDEKHRAARVLGNTAPRASVDDLARTNALHQALDEIERLRGLPDDRVEVRGALGPQNGSCGLHSWKETGQ